MSFPPDESAEYGTGATADRILRERGSRAGTITMYVPDDLLVLVPPENAAPGRQRALLFGDGGLRMLVFLRLAALVSDTMNPSLRVEPYERLLDIATRQRNILTVRILDDDNDLPRDAFSLVEPTQGEPVVLQPTGGAVLTVEDCRFRTEVFDQLAWPANGVLTFLAMLTTQNPADVATTAHATALARSLGLTR